MTPEVGTAVREIEDAFPDKKVDIEPELQGGAYVIVNGIFIGDQYSPSSSWIGFLIDFQYPRSDVYPLFIDGGVRRLDGQDHQAPISNTTWQGRVALQISRKSNRLDPATDTALTKLHKVLEWIRKQ